MQDESMYIVQYASRVCLIMDEDGILYWNLPETAGAWDTLQTVLRIHIQVLNQAHKSYLQKKTKTVWTPHFMEHLKNTWNTGLRPHTPSYVSVSSI